MAFRMFGTFTFSARAPVMAVVIKMGHPGYVPSKAFLTPAVGMVSRVHWARHLPAALVCGSAILLRLKALPLAFPHHLAIETLVAPTTGPFFNAA